MVVSDTHCKQWHEIHPEIRREIKEADIAIHCGDFVGENVLHNFQSIAQRSVVVHGNSDPPALRKAIPYVEIIEVDGYKIGVTHPAWGGPEFPLEELIQDFPKPVDVIVFGHFHETINEKRDGVLFVNPGQGYKSFMVDATIAIITISGSILTANIKTIEYGKSIH